MKRLIRFPLGLRADWLFVPTTAADVSRRTAVRVGLCSVPYLLIAWTFAAFVDHRLLKGFAYWFCVFIIPGGGLLLDLWRLRRTRELHPKMPSA
jgi:hypothetical protein